MLHERSLGKPSYYLIRKHSIGLHRHEQTALSRTCRQFRNDTSVLFFQKNIFMVTYLNPASNMDSWMRSLQPYHASAIQTVFWGLWGSRSNPEALKLLLANWMGIKRVGVYFYIKSRLHVANQEALKIAGFEPNETVRDGRIGLTYMWYERS